MTKGFVVCHAHIGLTKLNITSRKKKGAQATLCDATGTLFRQAT